MKEQEGVPQKRNASFLYPERRKRGRPAGSGRPLKSEAEKQPRRTVAMTDDLWAFCTSQPEGAGAFIRGLVEKERKSQCTKTRRRPGS